MSFADLKKNRSAAMQKLVEAAAKMNERSFDNDDSSYWAPVRDKSGNGYAVIRFLPAPKGEAVPWVRFWDHSFKGPTGKWYIEKSRTSIGEDDPLSTINSKLWNSGIEADKEVARSRKRRLHYVANILVITDTANPSNEGKVFKYKFGSKLFEKITSALQPKFADETPINAFDFWAGANFKLKVTTVEGYPNYDKSSFADASVLFNGDEKKLEELYESLTSLAEIVDVSKFKSYADLLKRLKFTLGDEYVDGLTGSSSTADALPAPVPARSSKSVIKDDEDDNEDLKPAAPVTKPNTVKTQPATTPKVAPVEATDEDDEDKAFFASIAKRST